MIKNATFVSVWDDGFEVASSCKVNTDTNKVFDIEQVCVDELDLEILDREYIIIDGNEYDVYPYDVYPITYCVPDDLADNEYWYN